MNNFESLTLEQVRLREVAEYTTTVADAQRAAGRVTPADCLAYGERQWLTAFPNVTRLVVEQGPQFPLREGRVFFPASEVMIGGSFLEIVAEDEPDYPRLFTVHQEYPKHQLRQFYESHRQVLADELATALSNNPPDPLLLLALLLKQSATRLLTSSDYLARVGAGLPPAITRRHSLEFSGPLGWREAAELAHFHALLAEFCNGIAALFVPTAALDTPAPSAPQTEASAPEAEPVSLNPADEWNALLCQPESFGVSELCAAFVAVGLLSSNGRPTPFGQTSKGAWAGAISALTNPPALLATNARAVRRCLKEWGVTLTENTLRNNTSADADNTHKSMNEHLGRR